MSQTPLIEVRNLCKTFNRFNSDYGLKDILLHSAAYWHKRRSRRVFTALSNISFSLYAGESLAILGANGAGKSTLLSILAGTVVPTSGSVSCSGRLGLMLELGSGFCHDLSGRENIMLNGLLLGAKKKELVRSMDKIIDFSGIHDFIDEPLRTYSTGMQTRLGFSIAIHMVPDIMLIDEVLSVGDSEFKRKCFAKLSEHKARKMSSVLVTHSLDDAGIFCNRAIYLEHGTVRFAGNSKDVIDEIRKNHCEY